MDASVWPYVADKATKYVVFLKVNPVLSYTYVGLWFKIFEVEKCTTLSNNSFPLCSFPVKYPYFNVCVWFFIFLFLTLATDTCIDQCMFIVFIIMVIRSDYLVSWWLSHVTYIPFLFVLSRSITPGGFRNG
jgi:hypothetical protein